MEILEKLSALGGEIQENIELKQYTTFKLGGPAKYFFVAKTREDIIKAVRTARELELPFFILGGGSNLLINDNGFAGLVIKIETRGLDVEGEIIKAEAGALLSQAVVQAMQNGLSGLEWACGIPGTIGGAVRGNCGAYGGDASGNVKKAEVYDVERERIIKMSNKECEFDYRESVFKKNNNLIVLGAEFELQAGDKEEIRKEILANTKARVCAQPKFPSVGCNFKNIIVDEEVREMIKKTDPSGEQAIRKHAETGIEKIGAAWFIDRAGLKGHTIGGAKVSDEHANFIIKFDEQGTASDVAELIKYIKAEVKNKFGLELTEEVQYVGFS